MNRSDQHSAGSWEKTNDVSRLFDIVSKANQIAYNTDLDVLLEQLLELILSICGTRFGTLSLLDQEKKELVTKATHGDKESPTVVGQRFSVKDGISGKTLREARPVIVEDLQNDPGWLGSAISSENKAYHNAISLPLLLSGSAMGVIQIFNYSQAPLELMQLLANRMASEIDKTILLQASNQRGQRMEALVGIIKEMSLTLDRDLLLQHIIRAARELINTEASSLFLIDDDSGDMILSIASHRKEISLPEIRIPAGQGIIGHVIARGEPIVVSDARADKRHYSDVDKISGLNTRSILAVPLRTPTIVLGGELGATKPKIIGGVEAINKLDGDFDEDDIQILLALADQAATVILLARLYADANELFIDTIKAITAAIDAKDPYTRGHSQRVSDFSRIMAQEMALSTETIHHIRVGGLLHDVGKIGIPDVILTKPGQLTEEEFDVVKNHTMIGANIMKEVRMLQRELPALAEHHERMDGKGYPIGLSKDEISLVGRIVAVADVFDALTSDRPYRSALSAEEALEILNDDRDTHLDSQIVDAFIQAYLAGKIKTQKERTQMEG